MRSLALFVTLLLGHTLRAQTWTFGPKVSLGLSGQSSVAEARIQDVVVSSGESMERTGSAFGLFARYDRPRWYAQLDGLRGKYTLGNLYVSSPAMSGGLFPAPRRHSLSLLAGIKPLPWLRIGGGLTQVFNQPNATPGSLEDEAASYDKLATEYTHLRFYYQSIARYYRVSDALRNTARPSLTEAQAQLGVDIGGLTVDLVYARSLTPLVDGLTYANQTYAFRQQYGYWSLQLGYRLLPLKRFLFQPRVNRRTYERVKRDIPHYRNEVSLAVGVTGDDYGGSVLFENRYTRYFRRRLGLTTVLGLARSYEDDNGFLPQATDAVQLSAMLRVLPLYTRRHTLAVSGGPVAMYVSGFDVTAGSQRTLPGGQTVSLVYLRPETYRREFGVGVQAQLDYQFALTDRLPVGLWLRVMTSQPMQYAALGVQGGYRF